MISPLPAHMVQTLNLYPLKEFTEKLEGSLVNYLTTIDRDHTDIVKRTNASIEYLFDIMDQLKKFALKYRLLARQKK